MSLYVARSLKTPDSVIVDCLRQRFWAPVHVAINALLCPLIKKANAIPIGKCPDNKSQITLHINLILLWLTSDPIYSSLPATARCLSAKIVSRVRLSSALRKYMPD